MYPSKKSELPTPPPDELSPLTGHQDPESLAHTPEPKPDVVNERDRPIWAGYDPETFEPTGEGVSMNEAAHGSVTGTAHLVVVTYDQEGQPLILLQKRSKNVKSDAGKFDVSSVAGHIDNGETATQAAVREAEEEAGLVVDPDKLIELERFVPDNHPRTLDFKTEKDGQKVDALAHEVITLFMYEVPRDWKPEGVDGEVESFEWVTPGQYAQLAADTEFTPAGQDGVMRVVPEWESALRNIGHSHETKMLSHTERHATRLLMVLGYSALFWHTMHPDSSQK